MKVQAAEEGTRMPHRRRRQKVRASAATAPGPNRAGSGAACFRIGEAAEASGVPVKTIRFYETIGLIPAAPRSSNRYRAYDEAAVRTLRFVPRVRELGFSLQETARLFAACGNPTATPASGPAEMQECLAALDRRIACLCDLRHALLEFTERAVGDVRPALPELGSFGDGRVASGNESPVKENESTAMGRGRRHV